MKERTLITTAIFMTIKDLKVYEDRSNMELQSSRTISHLDLKSIGTRTKRRSQVMKRRTFSQRTLSQKSIMVCGTQNLKERGALIGDV